MKIPVLRWPGGCFADEYHWKEGIGPRDKRPKMVNTHWGMVTDTNAFGTHEFLDLCEMLGCEAYIAGNVGSGTPEEMQDWVEYMNFEGDSEMTELRRKNGRDKPWRIKYFGVGNENWGCGGRMTPEYYADVYRRFQNYVDEYPGSPIVKIACGPNKKNTTWMEVLMKNASSEMDAISLHYYVRSGSGSNKGKATRFNENELFILMDRSLKIRDILKVHIEIMNRYDPSKRIGLYVDEWGTWWDAEQGTNPSFLYQQNTLRDAISAGIFLNEFNLHCDRVRMANIAQTINVLQAMILTDGPDMILTPTYHVFEMYKIHQGATLLPSNLKCQAYKLDGNEIPALNCSVSQNESNTIQISVCNINPNESAKLTCQLEGFKVQRVTVRVLTADDMTAHNTFDNPQAIKPVAFNEFEMDNGNLIATLPAKSVVVFEVK